MKHSCAPAAALIAALLIATTATAHHSYAMFDGSARREAKAVVAKLEWQNPHVMLWLYVDAPNGGEATLLALESDSINQLRRIGWARDSLVAGEPVTVRWFPLRDGRPGGHLISLTTASGRELAGAIGPQTAVVETTRERQGTK